MKSCSTALLDLIPNPKALSARATFRITRPQFETSTLWNNVSITDSALINSCAYGTGILRVTNYNDHLYTQYVTDVHSSWPNWVDTGIVMWPGSRPGVDGGYVWYEKTNGALYYRDFSNWSVEVVGRGDGDGLRRDFGSNS